MGGCIKIRTALFELDFPKQCCLRSHQANTDKLGHQGDGTYDDSGWRWVGLSVARN